MSIKNQVFAFLVLCIGYAVAENSKVYNLIYRDINPAYFDKCARLLNGTNEIGCQSSIDGNVGVLLHIRNLIDLNKFVSKSSSRDYTLLMDASLFTRKNVDHLKSNSKVQGIILYEPDNFELPIWSPDLQCPDERLKLYNESYGPEYSNCKKPWNVDGDALNEANIPFPIFYIKHSLYRDELINCTKYNVPEEYPLCAVQMKSWMFGAVDSVTCIRRSKIQHTLEPDVYCDPLGGRNIVTSLKRFSSTSKNKPNSTILVTAALDSRSFMSTSFAPGADTAMGLLSLLGISKALGELSQTAKNNLEKNIVFVLFDGEAFDNIGSTRMVHDMKVDQFPMKRDSSKTQPPLLNLTHIHSLIELGQLGLGEGNIWAHYDPVAYNNSQYKYQVDEIIKQVNAVQPTSISINRQSSGIGLVPSSLQSFLKGGVVPGVVLTDYDRNFTNKRYFSRYDWLRNYKLHLNGTTTDDNVRSQLVPLAQKLANISTKIARMLHQMASNESDSTVSVDENLMNQLLFCYLYKSNCSLFQSHLQFYDKDPLINAPYNRYISVYSDDLSKVGNMSLHLLASFTGQHITNFTSCAPTASDDQTVNYYHLKGVGNKGDCVISSTYHTRAVDASFDLDSLDSVQNSPGLWTESRWSRSAFMLRFFLVQSDLDQGMVLLAGLLFTIISFVAVYLLRLKSATLFGQAGAI